MSTCTLYLEDFLTVFGHSGGSLKLTSDSAFEAPLIDPALLTTDFDILTMVAAVKSLRRFLTGSSWQGYLAQPYVDSLNTTTDNGLVMYIRKWGTTLRHPTGTARMSKFNGKDGVVNPDLTVKGTEGLRVVDASVLVCDKIF